MGDGAPVAESGARRSRKLEHLRVEPSADDRSGPYLLYDDEREVEIRADADVPPPEVSRRSRRSLRSTAKVLLEILRTGTCEGAEHLDGLPLWWLAVRPWVLPLTALSVLIGVLLALANGGLGLAEIGTSGLVLVGAVAAHAGANLLHDWVNVRRGIDRDGSFRGAYAPHPLLAGQLRPSQVLAGAAALHIAALAILLGLVTMVGPGLIGFALAGFALSLAYAVPPLSLRTRGLGEVVVAVVWGPILTVGAFYALRGEAPVWVWLASLPYGLLVGSVLLGMHLDELREDPTGAAGTLPARIGVERARAFTVGAAEIFLVAVALLVAKGFAGPWALLVLVALPRLRRLAVACASERPAATVVGPAARSLWYAAFAMSFARGAGVLLVAGLALNLLLGSLPP